MSLPALPVDPEGSAPTSGQIYAPLTEEDPWLQLRVGVKNKVSNKCNLQVYPSSCSAFILLSVLVSCVFHIIYILSSELNNIFGLTVRKNWGKKIANNVVVQKFVTRCKLQSSKTGETCIKTIISYSNADLNSL